jgi:hypothetical protein
VKRSWSKALSGIAFDHIRSVGCVPPVNAQPDNAAAPSAMRGAPTWPVARNAALHLPFSLWIALPVATSGKP